MDDLFILGTAHTPEIDFKASKNIFIISGRSIPEDCDIYYYPVIRYLEAYLKELEQQPIIEKLIIKFEFKLVYYNTLSIRYLNAIMDILTKYNKIYKLEINWYYDTYDEYLLEMGENFIETFNLKINLIEVKPDLKQRK